MDQRKNREDQTYMIGRVDKIVTAKLKDKSDRKVQNELKEAKAKHEFEFEHNYNVEMKDTDKDNESTASNNAIQQVCFALVFSSESLCGWWVGRWVCTPTSVFI